jgi:hypothetical protein
VRSARRVGSIVLAALGVIGLVWTSMVAGAVFGLLAQAGLDPSLSSLDGVAMTLGAIFGVCASPVLAWALWVPPRTRGFLAIMAPTAAITYAYARVIGPTHKSLSCALVACALYVPLALSFGHWARKRLRVDPATLPRCPACGYSLRGLPFESKCPECGRPY